MPQQSFDLVLLDLVLPSVAGLQLCNEIRECMGPRIVVVVVSDCALVCERVTVLGLGVDDFVVKPYKTEDLLARIAAHLRRADISAVLADRGLTWSSD